MNEYETMEAAVASPLDRAVDKAIAEENRRVIATLCGKCSGTGTIYIPIGPEGREYSKHRREVCDRCDGTGDKHG